LLKHAKAGRDIDFFRFHCRFFSLRVCAMLAGWARIKKLPGVKITRRGEINNGLMVADKPTKRKIKSVLFVFVFHVDELTGHNGLLHSLVLRSFKVVNN